MPLSPFHPAAAYMLVSLFSCDAHAPPPVNFNYVEKPPALVADRSTDELRGIGSTLPSVNMADFPITSGIAQGKTDLQTSILFTTQKTLTGGYCLWPASVDITLTYQAQVFIAKNYAPSSCRYALTLQHEMRHVQTDEDTLKQFLPDLKKAAEDRAAKLETKGPFDESQRDQMQNLVTETLKEGLTRDLSKVEAEQEKRQALIDTPEEYTRLSRACAGEPLR